MKLKLSIFLFFSFVFSLKSKAQEGLEKYQNMAADFIKLENYNSAIEIYERLLFFGNDELTKEIYLPLARAYTAIGNYDQAAINFDNAYSSEKVDTLKYEIIFESALNYIIAGDTSLAYTELLNIPETHINARISNKLHLLMGTLDYKSGRYSSAEKHFLALTDLDKNSQQDIHIFIKKAKKINRRYNPDMVEWMSIIPGLGQVWCGYYKESANAFLLTGAFVVLFIDVSLKYRAIDGLLAVWPWLNRYYKGGIVKSYKLAERKIEVEKNKLLNNFLKALPSIN